MKFFVRLAVLVCALAWPALMSQPAAAQATNDLSNSKIEYAYYPPKNLKYMAIMDRLKKRRTLEQLSEFLSPLRLPHKFFLVSIECGKENAFYSSDLRAIVLCYEFLDLIDRVAPQAGNPLADFTRDEVVVGAFTGVILHEVGHAVFDMLEVPVFGREEDAADAMAAFIALQFNPQIARTVVRGFAYIWRAFGNPREWAQYADEHGTSGQRFYNTLCLAYGGDPTTFKEFVDKGWLPKERAEGCAAEYQQIRLAFIKTILPFIDQDMMKKVQAKEWLKAAN